MVICVLCKSRRARVVLQEAGREHTTFTGLVRNLSKRCENEMQKLRWVWLVQWSIMAFFIVLNIYKGSISIIVWTIYDITLKMSHKPNRWTILLPGLRTSVALPGLFMITWARLTRSYAQSQLYFRRTVNSLVLVKSIVSLLLSRWFTVISTKGYTIITLCASPVFHIIHRAIFRWITVKNLNQLRLDESHPSESPLGLLRGIQLGTESYHTLFKRLCRWVCPHTPLRPHPTVRLSLLVDAMTTELKRFHR